MATEGHKGPPPTKRTKAHESGETGESTNVSPFDMIGVGPDGEPLPEPQPPMAVNPYDPTGELGITTFPGNPASPVESTNVSPFDMIGVGPDGEPLPEPQPPMAVNPYDPTGELGITTYPSNPAAAPLVLGRSTYSVEDLPKTTVPKDLESLLLPPSVNADKPGSGGLNPPPPGVGVLGQLVLEMTPPGTKFEGETTIGPDGVPTTDWNVVVPGQEPTYWGRTQQVPLADGSSVDINYGSNGTPLLAKGEGDPALRLRLADDNGAPRWALLNSAGEYLFTIDSSGNAIGEGGSASTVDPSAGLAGLIGGAVGTGTTLGAALAESAASGAAAGAAAGAPTGPGAAVTAAIGVFVGVGLTYVMWKSGVFPGSPHGEPQDDGVKPVDPNSLPEIGQPQPWIPPRVNGDEGVQPPPLLEPRPTVVAPVDISPTAPRSPLVTQPTEPSRSSPADDPGTVSTQILFPSAVDGQKWVPVEGTYWRGNSLVWAKGNPAGMKPGTFAKNPTTKTELNLQAVLYKLLESGLDDVDEEHRPPIMAALAVLQGTLLYQQTFRGVIEQLGNPFGADIAKLTSPSLETSEEELERLADLGAPKLLLDNAINEWWASKAVVDGAKELLGEAGAIAMLKTDGWTVNARPRGSGTHDIVAVKNGEVMVIEAKGGNPGPPRPGEATVSAGPGIDTDIRAQQMTDPYLWHKLKEDAENDPEFKQWLIDHEVWTAIENEDPSRVGYRLIKVDTKGNIIVYGSEQIPTPEGIPAETVIGQTTGNGPGPRLRGVALPLSRANPFVGAGNFPVGVLGQAGGWLGGLIQAGLHDVAAIGQLAVPVPAVPALLPGFRPPRTPANESLTVNVVQHTPPPGQIVSDDERLRGMTYL